jgi:hypothetical protein
MDMTADQLTALMSVISHATQTLGWIVGIAVTIFLACFGGAMALIFRQNSERILDLEDRGKAMGEAVEHLKAEVGSHSAECARMRAGCREQFLTRYVTDSELKDMEKEFKELVHDTLRRLEAQLAESRVMLVQALKEVRSDITGAVMNHQHDSNGSVLIRKNGALR